MAEDRRLGLRVRRAAFALALVAGAALVTAAGAQAQDAAPGEEPLPEAAPLPEEAPLPGQGAAPSPPPRPAPPETEGESERDIEREAQTEAPEAAREEAVVLPAPMPRPADAEPGTRPAARPGPGWTLRAVPGAAPVALGGGPGQVASVAAFCLSGLPWLSLELVPQPEATRIRADFTFSSARVEAEAIREAGAGDAYVVELGEGPLAGLLAGTDSEAMLGIEGTQQGPLSLRGSTASIRAALAECHAF